jgi:hypothetical protein
MVVHICKSRYLGGRNWGGWRFKVSPIKKLASLLNKQSWVQCHMVTSPSHMGRIDLRTAIQARPGQKSKTLSEKYLKAKRAGGVAQVVQCHL